LVTFFYTYAYTYPVFGLGFGFVGNNMGNRLIVTIANALSHREGVVSEPLVWVRFKSWLMANVANGCKSIF